MNLGSNGAKFFSQKGSRGRRGVKEKNGVAPSVNEKIGITASVKDGITPYVTVVSKTVLVQRRRIQEGYELSYFTYIGGNGFDVVVLVESIRAITKWFANTAYGFFLGKRVAYLVVAINFRNTWGKYRLVKSMLNSSTRVFSFQFSSIEGFDAMLENEDVGNVSLWVKLHGVSVTAFSKHGLSAIATKLESSSTSTTPIVEKIDKMERLIIYGKLTLLDDEGKPLKKVDSSGDYDSEDEVSSVDNDMENFLALNKFGYGTHSLLEHWTDSYVNGYYDFDPYDDDMYEGQDIPDKIQDICDNFDIKVRGRRKK
ncbi:hypothetical protein Tco_0863089 [Tanacetum coccineum]